jgi:hypothetical protein
LLLLFKRSKSECLDPFFLNIIDDKMFSWKQLWRCLLECDIVDECLFDSDDRRSRFLWNVEISARLRHIPEDSYAKNHVCSVRECLLLMFMQPLT